MKSRSNNVSTSNLAVSLHDYFYNLDDPKPDQLHVPESAIHQDEEDPAYWKATLNYVTLIVGNRKKHSIVVRFKVDEFSNVIGRTCVYA